MPRISPSALPSAALLCAVFAFVCTGITTAESTERCKLADGFDFPVGFPDARGYHKARGFYPNGHLGEDWNGDGGGDTDLNDPIYATARGIVVFSENIHQGWGNMIIVRHVFREADGRIAIVDSLYGHMTERLVKVGAKVERGQVIAKMGGNDGMYPVHLHFEIHKNLTMGPNRAGFAHDFSNYYSPTPFIKARRALETDSRKYDIPVETFAPYGKGLSEAQVKRGKSLTIPVVTGPVVTLPKTAASTAKDKSGKEPPKPTLTTTGKTTGKPDDTKPPAPKEESKSDFWSRLRSKLGSGTATPGLDDKK